MSTKADIEAKKETRAAKWKAWYEANKEKCCARERARCEAKKESIAARRKAYREAHREELREKALAYYHANKKDVGVRARERRENVHPEKRKARNKLEHIKSRYGISREEHAILRVACDGRCQICKTPFSVIWKDQECIDHCHKSKVVRGLLCRACNTGLSQFNDNPELLRAAVRYLERPASNRSNRLPRPSLPQSPANGFPGERSNRS